MSAFAAFALRFLNALPDAAMLVDGRGGIVAANKPARQALGIDASAGENHSLESLVVDPPERVKAALRGWMSSTEPTPWSFSSAKDEITYNARGSLVRLAEGGQPAAALVRFAPRAEANPFVLLNQKVTELNDEVARRVQVEEALRRSEIALRERALEAESANRAKDEFLATVSHELRTPLNAILGWSSLMLGHRHEPQVEKAFDVIHRNAVAQAKLVDDILDVSRIITGKLALETRSVDLATLVDEAVEVVRPSADAKRLSIAWSPPPGGCVMVADPDRLRQVIWNLLSNAVKFTPPGGKVEVETAREGEELTILVRDSGEGIEPEFLPWVFDRFRQADSSTTRRAGGLGLGLALVRHIVELHGGEVEAQSEGRGKGATFRIRLPSAITPGEVLRPRARAPLAMRPVGTGAAEEIAGLPVLVVDDERDTRELVCLILGKAGAEVESAASAAEAFTVLRRFRPRVIVSDIGLPDEDGYSFMRRLRRMPPETGRNVPALALTAYTRAEDRSRALAAGFTAYLGKPVHPEELLRVVAELVSSG